MRSTLGIFAFGLAASVAAHEHNHQHFHERGASAAPAESCEVQYTTVTSYGEWGLVPGTKSAAPSSSSSSSSSTPPPPPPAPTTTSSSSTPPPPPPPETTSAAPAPAPPSSTPIVQYKIAVSEPAPAPAPTSDTPAPAAAPVRPTDSPKDTPKAWGDSGYIAANGDKWAFCYTPYTQAGQCKDASTVDSDLASLKGKGFTSIRTYANDCNGVVNIGKAARAHGLKIILGLNIDGAGVSAAYGRADDLASWGKDNWDLVEMVVVGNEAIFAGFCSASQLVDLIHSVKDKFRSAGYGGPVTTTEPLGTIQEYGSVICPAVDVIAANIHPFFNTAVSALLAGPFAATQLENLAAVCGHTKEAYCLETGWPSGGSANGIAIPGIDAQKIAVTGIMAAIGKKAAVFSYENDNWKAPGQFGVEQNWGCSGLF